MPWLYGDLMDSVRALFTLRERLLPYLQAKAERARVAHRPLIYPVFLRQPDYDCEADCFFCGEKILACPVFDRGAKAVTVTLPSCGAHWRLRGGGEPIPGGATLTVPCLATDLPAWFEAE